MKVFALLLSFLLFSSCSTPFGLHDWDGFLVGLGHPVEEFSSYGEEEVDEPSVGIISEGTTNEERPQTINHDPRIPYDFSFVERIDWEAHRPQIQEAETATEQEQDEVQHMEETHSEDSLSGDDIVLLACMFMFLLIVMIGSVTIARRRRD